MKHNKRLLKITRNNNKNARGEGGKVVECKNRNIHLSHFGFSLRLKQVDMFIICWVSASEWACVKNPIHFVNHILFSWHTMGPQSIFIFRERLITKITQIVKLILKWNFHSHVAYLSTYNSLVICNARIVVWSMENKRIESKYGPHICHHMSECE